MPRPASAMSAFAGSSQLPPALRGFPPPSAFAVVNPTQTRQAVRPYSAPTRVHPFKAGMSWSLQCRCSAACYAYAVVSRTQTGQAVRPHSAPTRVHAIKAGVLLHCPKVCWMAQYSSCLLCGGVQLSDLCRGGS